MDPLFKIFVDRLKDGEVLRVNETIPSDFLDVKENELSFGPTAHIKYEAYLADEHLIMNHTASVKAYLPCSICNERIEVAVNVASEYHSESLESLRSHVYDATPMIRESILLQVPPFVECCGGNCPERENLTPYLVKASKDQKEVTHNPFADL